MSDVLVPAAREAAAAPPAAGGAASGSAACASCGASLAGEYCHACGQRARRGRFTVRGIFAHLVTDAFDLNRGLLFTAVALTVRPGAAIRDYVDGATARYTNPVKYLVVCVALAVFASVQVGVTRDMAGGFAEGMGAESAAVAERIGEVLSRYMNVIMAAAVPFMALYSRALFRRSGLNFAEHLIFSVYVYAQQSLLFLPFLPLTMYGATKDWGMLGYTAAIAAYYAWAAAGFFRERWRSAMPRALGVLALGTVTYYLVIGIAAAFALRAAGWV
ncbi:MAG TPA: DUF3667 domain-containing protein [Longimicrobiaceae bacterium]|nr:DUF3667 domain-containing protein [Longimicrobiaceae bacterium]